MAVDYFLSGGINNVYTAYLCTPLKKACFSRAFAGKSNNINANALFVSEIQKVLSESKFHRNKD